MKKNGGLAIYYYFLLPQSNFDNSKMLSPYVVILALPFSDVKRNYGKSEIKFKRNRRKAEKSQKSTG